MALEYSFKDPDEIDWFEMIWTDRMDGASILVRASAVSKGSIEIVAREEFDDRQRVKIGGGVLGEKCELLFTVEFSDGRKLRRRPKMSIARK